MKKIQNQKLYLTLLFVSLPIILYGFYHYFSKPADLPKAIKCNFIFSSKLEGEIFSERLTKSYNIILTEKGLYRKLISETTWYFMDSCPSTLHLGDLQQTTSYSDNILSASRYGLYLSPDAGLSWTLLSNEFSFNTAFIDINNLIYSTATVYIECPSESIVLQENAWKRTELDGITHCIRDKILISSNFRKYVLKVIASVCMLFV